MSYNDAVKKFKKPVSIFYVVVAVLVAGILVGGLYLGKSTNNEPEVLNIATKSVGEILTSEPKETKEIKETAPVEQEKETSQLFPTGNIEDYYQNTQTSPTQTNISKVEEKPKEEIKPPAPPAVDNVSYQALKKKFDNQEIARGQINTFWGVVSFNNYPTVFLDNAQGYINKSIALNSSVSTSHPEALNAFNLLKKADSYTSQAISHYKEYIRLHIKAFTYSQFSAEFRTYSKLADDEFDLGHSKSGIALDDSWAAFNILWEIKYGNN